MGKKYIFILLGIIVTILIILILVLNQFGLLIVFATGNIQEKFRATSTRSWQGIDLEIISATPFGEARTSSDLDFCGDDGDVRTVNNFVVNTQLKLTAVYVSERGCANNYLRAKLILPKGKLTGTCKISVGGGRNGLGMSSCNIKKLNYNFQEGIICGDIGCSKYNLEDSFEFVITEPTEIEIELLENAEDSGFAEAEIILNFEEFKDQCIGVTCNDYCENSIRYYDGFCKEGECNYKDVTCSEGCSGNLCKAEPCEGMECPNICENSIYKSNGQCINGRCSYSETSCDYGCEGEKPLLSIIGDDMCRDSPCTGTVCEDYCSANSLFYSGKCLNGECTNFREKEHAEECGFKPFYKNIWVYVGAVTFIIIVIFSIWYYIKRLR